MPSVTPAPDAALLRMLDDYRRRLEELERQRNVSPPARAYATTIGNGASTSFTITHNLGTRDVLVSVRRVASPYDEIYVGLENRAATTNTVTLAFDSPPSSNQFRVKVVA